MILLGPNDEITLDAIGQGCILWFEVGDERHYVRPPTTEQFDEASGVERVAGAAYRAREGVAALATLPPSADDIVIRKREIARYEKLFNEAEDGTTAKENAADMIAALQVLMENRSRADQETEQWAMLKRDRYLVLVCLCDAEGVRLFTSNTPETLAAWESLPLVVKDNARSCIWRILRAMRLLPFASATPPVPESA